MYIGIRTRQEVEVQALTMASHVASLRGWHTALARAEISSLLPMAVVKRLPARRLIQLEGEISPEHMLEAVNCSSGCQALLSHAVLWSTEQPIDSLLKQMSDYIQTHTRTGAVAVRSWKHEGKMEGVSARDLMRKIGGMLSSHGYKIDLEQPEHRLGMVLDAKAGVVACGWMIGTGDDSDGISARRATDRPFFKPVSLDPRLARLAVNLASGPLQKGVTLDLMTGTGGFVLEAAVSGREAYGIDLDSEMIEGAQKNLDWAAPVTTASLLLGDATRLLDVLPSDIIHRICGFVLDPPYGRNSQGTLEPTALIRAVLESSYSVAATDAHFVLIVPIHPFGEHAEEALPEDATVELLHGQWSELEACFEQTGWRLLGRWVEHVHASLGRLILHAVIVPRD